MKEQPSDQDILAALEGKDALRIQAWVEQGLSPVWSDAAGNSLLHYAAAWGDAALAELLLKKKARADIVNALQETPEDTARIFGWDALGDRFAKQARVERLSAPPAFPFQSLDEIRRAFEKTGTNPLEEIIRVGHFDKVVALALKDPSGISSGDLLVRGANGESLLLKLCRTGQLPALMLPALWIKNVADFHTLWAEVPEHFRQQVDYTGFVGAMHRARLQNRNLPKLDKGP